MYKVLIWGAGYGYSQYINLLKYQELLSEIQIIGVTGRDSLYDYLDGYPFIPLGQINEKEFDYIVVTSDINFAQILDAAMNQGIPKEHILLARVFAVPNFRFSKYVNIQSSNISIIANNCWGGLAYHTLGLEFRSPFINMFERDEDYLKLLSDLKYYLGLELKLTRFDFEPILKRKYPVCKLGDIELHFNHYVDMEEVEAKWYKRVEKVNWDNLFVMMYTSEEKSAIAFDELSYEKKICFVPFGTSLKSAYYMQMVEHKNVKKSPFWEIVNNTASGHYHDYDLIDLLSTGKIEKNRCAGK